MYQTRGQNVTAVLSFDNISIQNIGTKNSPSYPLLSYSQTSAHSLNLLDMMRKSYNITWPTVNPETRRTLVFLLELPPLLLNQISHLMREKSEKKIISQM